MKLSISLVAQARIHAWLDLEPCTPKTIPTLLEPVAFYIINYGNRISLFFLPEHVRCIVSTKPLPGFPSAAILLSPLIICSILKGLCLKIFLSSRKSKRRGVLIWSYFVKSWKVSIFYTQTILVSEYSVNNDDNYAKFLALCSSPRFETTKYTSTN